MRWASRLRMQRCKSPYGPAFADEPRLLAWRGEFWVLFAARPTCFTPDGEGCPWCDKDMVVMQYVLRLAAGRGGFFAAGPAAPVVSTSDALGSVHKVGERDVWHVAE